MALVLEALASVPEAKVPEDTFRSGLEFFTGSWIEDDGRVDLELELEKDAPLVIDPKKDKDLVPINWPALMGKQNPNDMRPIRKGSFFTVVAWLRMLSLLPECLKLDELQLKCLEQQGHRALANLQMCWRLRSVQTFEAAW